MAIERMEKTGLIRKINSVFSAALIFFVAIFSSGVMANEILGKEIITKKDFLISFKDFSVNEMFYYNEEIENTEKIGEIIIEKEPETVAEEALLAEELQTDYQKKEEIPSEIPQKETVSKNEVSYMSEIDKNIPETAEMIGFEDEEDYSGYFIGDMTVKEKTSEIGEVIKISYNSDENEIHSVQIVPDENGVIALNFQSEISEMVASVEIRDSEKSKGWDYKVPTDSSRVYKFYGFNPEKTYVIDINAYCPGNYNISGNALIY